MYLCNSNCSALARQSKIWDKKNPVGLFPNLLCNLINKPSNKQQIGSSILGVVHVPAIMSLQNKMFSYWEVTKQLYVVRWSYNAELQCASSCRGFRVPVMRKAEGVHASLWERTRKTASFPKHSQFKTTIKLDMSACSTPLLRKQWFLSTIYRLFWIMVIMNMFYWLKNSFPPFFAILSQTNVEWAKLKCLKSSYLLLVNETE